MKTITFTSSGGTLTMNAFATAGFVFRSFIDWYTLPESKSEIRERPVSDGAFGIDRDFRQSLALSLEGAYLGSDEVDAALARLAFNQVLGGRDVSVAVEDALGVTSRRVSVRLARPNDDGLEEWTCAVDMIATDSNRYGASVTATTGLPTSGTGAPWPTEWSPGYNWGTGGDPGRASATNTGSATTYPVLEVLGGLTGGVELVEITTGSYLRLERDIPATSVVYFDTRTQRVYLDIPANDIGGTPLKRADWEGFVIPAGATRTVQFNALGPTTGSPTLTLRYSPAY